MKPEIRDTTFFKKGENLAVFARNAVDVEQSQVLGHTVVLSEIPVDESMQVTKDINRRFWAVTEHPPELLTSLAAYNHAVRGTSRYRVGQPDNRESLNLLRWAEEKVKGILFPENHPVESPTVISSMK